jgi:hypothetical protein
MPFGVGQKYMSIGLVWEAATGGILPEMMRSDGRDAAAKRRPVLLGAQAVGNKGAASVLAD